MINFILTRTRSAGLGALVLLSACANATEKSLSVMVYNLQNLFDTQDDPKTNDETFLPVSAKVSEEHRKICKRPSSQHRMWECLFLDWTPAALDQKMKNLATKVLSVGDGKGPDILMVEEVENRAVLEEWNKKYLAKAGYSVVHQDSHDPRGIDQAILTRLPVKDFKYHEIHYTKESKSKKLTKKSRPRKGREKELRGILEAVLTYNNKTLHVLALHLPSQGASFAERAIVFNELNKLAESLPADHLVLAGGDFNVSKIEFDKEKVYQNYLSSHWSVAHLEGCQDCKGTHYYSGKREWSFFDMLLLRKEKASQWSWNKDSVKIVSGNDGRFPASFDALKMQGASDHWPLSGTLTIK